MEGRKLQKVEKSGFTKGYKKGGCNNAERRAQKVWRFSFNAGPFEALAMW